jgi:ankyrin repeat protein
MMYRCGKLLCVALVFSVASAGVPAFGGEIHKAAAAGDAEKIKALLEKDPKLANATDGKGITPLYYAAGAGHEEACRALLDGGALVNGKVKDGRTALHAAAWRGRLGVVKLLVKRKADVNAKAEDGATPLLEAEMNVHTKVAKFLRKHGAK